MQINYGSETDHIQFLATYGVLRQESSISLLSMEARKKVNKRSNLPRFDIRNSLTYIVGAVILFLKVRNVE